MTLPGAPKKSFWDQPVRRRRAHSPAYTRFVRWMRLLLPLAAVAVVGVLVAWPDVQKTMIKPPPPPDPATAQQAASIKNELVNPRFESRDKQQRPFVITADRAVQSVKDPGLALLDAPKADMTFADGAYVSASAAHGEWRQDENALALDGDVRLFHSLGYEMTTARLLVNLGAQKAWSDQPVSGQGPAGTLQASGVQADGGAGTLVFTGPATLVLNKAIKGL